MLQIGTGKLVLRDFSNAAVFHGAAQHLSQHCTDLGFTLAAVALNDHHPLSLIGGNQAVADKLLQGGDVLWVKQTIQKGKPQHRLRLIRAIEKREPVSHNVRLALYKGTVQHERPVCQMNPVLFRREVLHMSHQLHNFNDVADFAGNVVHGTVFQFLKDFPTKRQLICNPAVGCKKSSVYKDNLMFTQKIFAKQSFIDTLAVKPNRHIHIRQFPVL